MILLTKFASGRDEKPDTIRKYISRHEEEFAGHIRIAGKSMELDEEAVKMLEEVYPLPKPVEIIQGVDPKEYAAALEQLNQAKDLIIKLQQMRQEDLQKLATAEAAQILLEDKEKQLQEKNEVLRELKEECSEEREKRTAAEQELQKLKERNVFERLFRKGE